MRISDWSSDVCSSDLKQRQDQPREARPYGLQRRHLASDQHHADGDEGIARGPRQPFYDDVVGLASARKRNALEDAESDGMNHQGEDDAKQRGDHGEKWLLEPVGQGGHVAFDESDHWREVKGRRHYFK